MKKNELAENLFRDGYNCSQAVFLAYNKEFGIDESLIAAISAPFGGGISRSGKTCGCLTGALMVLGAKLKGQTKEDVYKITTKFMNEFKVKFKATDCIEIIKNWPQNEKRDRCATITNLAVKAIEELDL